MAEFIYSGFADEISDKLSEQIKCLKKLNINYLEFRSLDGINVEHLDDETIKNAAKVLFENNIKVSSIGSPVGKYPIEEDFNIQIEKFRRIIEIAKMMKTNCIRIFSFFCNGRTDEAIKKEVVRRLKEFVKIAENENVILLHENESGIFGESDEECKYLFDNIKSPNFKAVFDPANFVREGYDTLKAFELLKDNIFYMHIKDSDSEKNNVPAGMGLGNIEEILSRLNKMNYHGFVSLEPHLGHFKGFENLEKGRKILNGGVYGGDEAFTLAYEKLSEIIKRII